MRTFEFRKDGVEKFFCIEKDGRTLTVRYGKIGTDGVTQSKTFDGEFDAEALYDGLVSEKLGKGYVEIAPSRKGTFDDLDQFLGDPAIDDDETAGDSAPPPIRKKPRATKPVPAEDSQKPKKSKKKKRVAGSFSVPNWALAIVGLLVVLGIGFVLSQSMSSPKVEELVGTYVNDTDSAKSIQLLKSGRVVCAESRGGSSMSMDFPFEIKGWSLTIKEINPGFFSGALMVTQNQSGDIKVLKTGTRLQIERDALVHPRWGRFVKEKKNP